MRISEHSITSNHSNLSQVIEGSSKLINAMDKHPTDQPEFNDYALSYGEEDEASDDSSSDYCGLEHFALLKNKAVRQKKMIERTNKRREYNFKKTQQLDIFCNASVSSLEVDMGGNLIDEGSDDDSSSDVVNTPLRFINSLERFDSMPARPTSGCDSLGPSPIRQKSKRCLSDIPKSAVEGRLRTQRRDSRWSADGLGSLHRDCLLASIADSSDRNLKRDCLLASVGKAVELQQTGMLADEKNPTNRTATAGPILSDNNKDPPQSLECRWSPDFSRDSMPNVSRRSR